MIEGAASTKGPGKISRSESPVKGPGGGRGKKLPAPKKELVRLGWLPPASPYRSLADFDPLRINTRTPDFPIEFNQQNSIPPSPHYLFVLATGWGAGREW